MSNDSYKEFSQIYDLLMNVDMDYNKWTAFIKEKLGKKNKILEAACGTGNITSILSENYKITAFDLSEDMLMKAYEKLDRNTGVKLLNQNMIDFKIDDKFDACICCCDGVNYLNEEEVLLFFQRVQQHLKKQGIFLFDISTDYKYETTFNDTYVYDDGDVFYVWENMIEEESNEVNVEINFFVKEKNEKYNRITEFQTQYIHIANEISSNLKSCGFSDIEIYDDYNNVKYSENSLRAVFICKLN